jgi:hypothetical protein
MYDNHIFVKTHQFINLCWSSARACASRSSTNHAENNSKDFAENMANDNS